MNFRIWLLWGVGVVGLLYAEWRLLPVPTKDLGHDTPAQEWRLPMIADEPLGRAWQALSLFRPWQDMDVAAAAKATAVELPPRSPAWKMLGVMRRGNQSYLALQVEGQPIRELRAGESLPDGSQVIEISTETVCIEVNGRRRALRIFAH